ncbi:hypothetical protein ACFWMH_10315 [Streptomyces tendae]|uniref:hypothetical protein n=1 Tax=Streptomyces tendae TaxID=1932 RepID=UPI00364AC315
MKRDPLAWAALAAALAVTASAEYALARAAGFGEWTAAALPAALDIYAVRALRARRDVAAAVAAMIATNAAAHLVAAGLLPVDWPLVVAVSAIAPLVLWRVHRLADHVEATPEQPLVPLVNTARPAAVPLVDDGTDTPGKEIGAPNVPVTAQQRVAGHRAVTAPHASPLVICGEGQVYALAVPTADTDDEVNTGASDEVTAEPVARLATAQAREVIEACWVNGVSIRETARRATRSPAYVTKVFAKLDEGGGPTAPVPGQLALVSQAASA